MKNFSDIKFPMRLQVYLSKCSVASRRKSEMFISEGRITVNGTVVTELGTKVLEKDLVQVDGKTIKLEKNKIYLLLNKPKGYLCASSDEYGRPLALDLLKESFTERIYNVGRLDLYSNGAIIFTNDGEFARIVSHPASEIEKEYFVKTVLPFKKSVLKQFKSGINIEGIFYKCKSAKALSNTTMLITLIEGKNREIRRVLNYFNIRIRQLTRIRIGCVKLNGLESGKFRHLTKSEINKLLSNVDSI